MFNNFRPANILRATAVAGLIGAAAVGLAGTAYAADATVRGPDVVAVPGTHAPDTASILRGPYGYDWNGAHRPSSTVSATH